jgi:hypothetical protein
VLCVYVAAALKGEITPSYEDVMRALSINNKSMVSKRVGALLAKGFLRRADPSSPFRKRNFIVTDTTWVLMSRAHGAAHA